jgi:GDP-mannose 6-dehydrogenase
MRISVLGLGYVGCVSAACLAARGNEVVGVDISPHKVDLINQGRAPIVEERVAELTSQVVESGALWATEDLAEAIGRTDVSLVCVATPSAPNGSLSTVFLERVARDIGTVLRDKTTRHTIVFRSTMLPGTCLDLLIPTLEQASGLRAGVDFGVAVNPEFLREGTSVRDFFAPPKTIIGEFDAASGEMVAALYDGLPGQVFRVPIPVAEMVKYADNAFHGLKIGFANEMGAICQALGLDSHDVMDLFLADTKLNISPAYLRPGFAFGGSCLPKDLRGLVYAAQRADVSVPILSNVLASNETHLRRAIDAVVAAGARKIGLLGLSFKPGTDDLRESPYAEMAERLLGKGFDLKIYDANVSMSRLVGANKQYIETVLPHLGELLTSSAQEVVDHAEVCIVACADPEVIDALGSAESKLVIDLVRLPDARQRRARPGYVGIAW